MAAINKDLVLVVSLVLSIVSLVLLFAVTWYFQLSLDLLQQQVEHDRELLFELQEQINTISKDDNSLNEHDVVKRQSDQNCQCKDGIPGPRGPPGNKGEMGKQGHKGDTGPPGPRGDAGDQGPRGDAGDQGPRGPIGDTGLRGPVGKAGIPGTKGDKGDQGPLGTKGDKGDTGPQGFKGEMGYEGLKGDKGSSRSPRSTELAGSKGGTVYIRWGHDQCPSTAQLVYSGRAGGSLYRHSGGGSNPQCLPLDPNFLTPISGDQRYRAYMYGAEYQTYTYSYSYIHGRHNADVPCAVCHVSSRTAVYMVPAKYTCPSGWTREYYGYLMAENHHRHHRSQYTCMDTAFKPALGSSENKNGLLFYFVEGKCGSLPCSPYDNTKELSCSVCTK